MITLLYQSRKRSSDKVKDTFDVVFTQSWIDGYDFGTDGYAYFTMTYTAVLNENAIVKDANGVAIVDANNKTHYSLEEINPPAGYNKLTKDVDVSVNASNDTRADVTNNKGTELPSTGGIGTTIFYILGGVLIVGAAIILVARRKAHD